MTTTPIGLCAAGLYPSPGTGSEFDQSTLVDAATARALVRDSVRIDRDLSSGHGLHPLNVLRYVAARDRADNQTGRLAWRGKEISARCGITSGRNDTGLFATLQAAGHITDYVRSGPGTPYRVTFSKVPANRRLVVPLAAVWTHRWATDAESGLRYGSDTAQVLRWLLAEMRSADYDTHGLTFTNRLPAPAKARRAGLSLSAYRRAWATVTRVCASDPWIQWTQTARADDGLDAWEVTINWRLLPAYGDAPTTGGDPVFEQGGDPLSEQGSAPLCGPGVTHFVNDLYKETNPFSPDPSQPLLSPQPSPARHARARAAARWHNGGQEKIDHSTPRPPEAARRSVPASAALTSAQDDTASSDTTAGPGGPDAAVYDAWCDAVISGVTDPTTPRSVTLSAEDIAALAPALRAVYDLNLQPAGVIGYVTSMATPTTSAKGAVEWRLRYLTLHPSKAAAAGATSSRRQDSEDEVFARAARARDASVFTRREM